MKYYIYHIPGKKIGVTRNLSSRVTQQQGYAEDEYEVLFVSDDIKQVSMLEVELQKAFGYPVDPVLYMNLFKSTPMKLNSTEQTTTFPMPLDKLKGRLMDNLGLSWVTPQGYRFTLDAGNAVWIANNARTSAFTSERCYIYNKAFFEYEKERFARQEQDKEVKNKLVLGEYDHFDNIRKWADKRGIYAGGDAKTQYIKLQEEAGELAKAILKEDDVEFIDAIGDCVVVLTNLAHLGGYSIEECIDAAWTQISNRKGSMKNGTFVKEESTAKESTAEEFIHPESTQGLWMTKKHAFSEYLKSKSETL
jgi:NTP pyrophosphatase (non-canonical NTP hydrolase)